LSKGGEGGFLEFVANLHANPFLRDETLHKFFKNITPAPLSPEAVKKFLNSPPPCPSPVTGEGISFLFQQVFPLPAGRGKGEGANSIFFSPSPSEGEG
jgi:hypothetical protein